MTLDFIKNNPFPNLDEFTQIMFNISKKSNSSFVVIEGTSVPSVAATPHLFYAKHRAPRSRCMIVKLMNP